MKKARKSIRLCTLKDLDRTGAKGVEPVELTPEEFVVVRDEKAPHGIRAYKNNCPHQGAPLETFPDRFLDETGRFLICTAHGARFRIEDGFCISGPCKAKSLITVTIRVQKDGVFYDF